MLYYTCLRYVHGSDLLDHFGLLLRFSATEPSGCCLVPWMMVATNSLTALLLAPPSPVAYIAVSYAVNALVVSVMAWSSFAKHGSLNVGGVSWQL